MNCRNGNCFVNARINLWKNSKEKEDKDREEIKKCHSKMRRAISKSYISSNNFHKLESIRQHNHCIKAAGRMQLICDAQYVRW